MAGKMPALRWSAPDDQLSGIVDSDTAA